MERGNKVIEIKNIRKDFGKRTVLKDINFDVYEKEVVSIIGSSGSGKSTLLRCINLLERPTEGEILFHGKDIISGSMPLVKLREKVGMVFQQFNLFNNLSVLDNCVIGQMKVLKKSREEAEKIAGSNPDFYQEDLINAIEKGNYPKWTLYIQVMTEAEACEFRWNPFDVTKIWPQTEFPLIEVGELELNQVPEDYYSHTELATFAPSNVVAGIAFSPDKVLQSRIFAYPDAQRYRVGVNAHNLEVNRSNANYTEHLNWDTCSITHFENENTNENDHYTQAGLFYTKALNETEKTNLINNIVHSLNKIKSEEKNDIINRQLCHFFRTNIELGMKVSIGLGLDINNDIMQMMNHK